MSFEKEIYDSKISIINKFNLPEIIVRCEKKPSKHEIKKAEKELEKELEKQFKKASNYLIAILSMNKKNET